ncbi:redox-sensitive transcriptional activator SoxR [Altererythrobacter luteolus]|uniref:Redox-sensitive transcriptional activator SoxR n=1 Tax=Pontixanthobacter luteolus TaxID=295089 RepID=A0A6I4V1Q9_9SPHN|nr:redox-sensitive transcriptional activator SoxR [Pontixanthobacter luteolus]MXP46986.1 redox-sensitive transcriptional activator SoxR [Pontixanthobacter luteolus]
MKANDTLTIGDLARRTGLSVSAIRFYEERGLVEPMRTSGNQRRFLRSDIRRLSFVMIAQRLGLALDQIEAELARLPHGRTPNARDWARISTSIRSEIDRRIDELQRVRSTLDGCIGCGCLSLKKCRIYNKDDRLAAEGPGPRNALG